MILEARDGTWQDVEDGVYANITTTTETVALPWPWKRSCRPEFQPPVDGFWPWNPIRGRVTAFRNRIQGPYAPTMSLQRGRWNSMRDFIAAGGLLGRVPPLPVMDELPVLCEWLAARPAVANLISRMSVMDPPTTELPPGTWVEASMRNFRTHPLHPTFNQTGYHGTSMNNLGRCLFQGVQVGWSAIREGASDAVTGIYIMGANALDLCSSYTVYTPLQRSGYYYAPYIQIRYRYDSATDTRKHVAKRAQRASQYVTYPDVSAISAVYFHVVSAADMVSGPKLHWLTFEPERPSNMEIPLEEAHESIVRRSHKRWVHAKSEGYAPKPVEE